MFNATKQLSKTMCATVLGLTFATSVHAVPSEYFYMVTPASCMPGTTADKNKLTFSSGAWVLDSGAWGTAHLYCPVNFSGKNTTSRVDMTVLSYIDHYTANGLNEGQVSAELKYRYRSASGTATVIELESDEGNGNAYGIHYLAADDVPDLSLHPSLGRIYFLHVKLYREAYTYHTLAFTGFEIRFDDLHLPPDPWSGGGLKDR